MNTQKIDYKHQLRKIIERHGLLNPIERSELRQQLGLSEKQDRQMRMQINELRKSGLPILFSTSKPCGYYLPHNLAEVQQGRKHFQDIIRDECITLAALKTYGARFVQKEEQIPLI